MRARLFFLALAGLTGCPSPPPVTVPDAPFVIPDVPVDAGPAAIWEESADFPVPIAYANAMILESGGTRWLFVFGGADADRDSLDTLYSSIYRAEIASDGSLGDWVDAGDITVTTGAGDFVLQIAQHGGIHLDSDETPSREGLAIAGGISSAGPVPRVLGAYVDADGNMDHFGAFPPSLPTDGTGQITAGNAHVHGTFDEFGAHELALIGGFGGDGTGAIGAPSDHVDIAPIDTIVPMPPFVSAPPLPAPRVAHRSVTVGITVYLLGGENETGPIADVLRTDRDAGGTGDVVGWVTAGTMDDPPSDHAAFALDGEIWVLGGIEGGRDDGLAVSRVRRAPVEVGGALGAWSDAPAHELPVVLADSAVAVDGRTVYMVGGRSVGGLASSRTVLIGHF